MVTEPACWYGHRRHGRYQHAKKKLLIWQMDKVACRGDDVCDGERHTHRHFAFSFQITLNAPNPTVCIIVDVCADGVFAVL